MTRFLFLYLDNGSGRSSQKSWWLGLCCDQHRFLRIEFQACITQKLNQFVQQRHYFMGRPREYQNIICKSPIQKWWQDQIQTNIVPPMFAILTLPNEVLQKTFLDFWSKHASLSHACVDLKSTAAPSLSSDVTMLTKI